MMGKSFETVLYLLSIGVLQQNTAFGCQTNSDCLTETTTGAMKQCCYKVFPPKCMDRIMCYLYRKDNTKPTSVDRIRDVTTSCYDSARCIQKELGNMERQMQMQPRQNNVYNYDDNDSAKRSSRGIIIAVVISIILVTILSIYRLLRHRRSNENHLRENCNVPPPATTNTSRSNLAAQQSEEPSRIVIIAVTRDEDHIRNQNLPPDGEPPFLSEEDILHNLNDSRAAQQPPPYKEAVTEPNFPQYEGLDNAAMDQPPLPAYSEVQATSQNAMNSSQITPSPNVPPPSYEEALISIT